VISASPPCSQWPTVGSTLRALKAINRPTLKVTFPFTTLIVSPMSLHVSAYHPTPLPTSLPLLTLSLALLPHFILFAGQHRWYPYVHSPLSATPYAPVLHGQRPEMHPTHHTSDLPWMYMEFPIEIQQNNVQTFETVDPNLLYIGADTSTGPHQPSDIFYPGNRPSVSITAPMEPGPSGTSVMLHEAQGQPTVQEHKYQCTMCQRIFDRMSRLENCRNIHANAKPHRCFGVCGRPEWYVPLNFDSSASVLSSFYYNLAQRDMDPQSSSRDISTGTLRAPPGKFREF
jgi:hypothetical protein